VVKYKASYKQ